jgi:hypothetical protein
MTTQKVHELLPCKKAQSQQPRFCDYAIHQRKNLIQTYPHPDESDRRTGRFCDCTINKRKIFIQTAPLRGSIPTVRAGFATILHINAKT